MVYKIIGTNLSYDDVRYRQILSSIESLKRRIGELPEELRPKVSIIVDDAISAALKASKEVYTPLLDEEKLKTLRSKSNDFLTDFNDLERISTK